MRRLVRVLLLVSCPLLFSQEIVTGPPKGSLAERWTWAERQPRRLEEGAPYWVAYSITRRMAADEYLVSASLQSWGSRARVVGTPFFLRIPDGKVSHAPAGTRSKVTKQIALLFEFRGRTAVERLERLLVTDVSMPVNLEDRPMQWLGEADPTESFRLLESLYGRAREPRPKRALLTGVGFHDVAEAVPFLGSVARAATESVEARREAVESLGQIDLTESLEALIGFARGQHDRAIRREAVEALGRKDSPRALETLVSIVRQDADLSVRQEAVEALAETGAGGLHHLIEFARSHSSVEVRVRAVEALGRAGAPESLSALSSLLDRDDDTRVQREAVQALARLPGDEAFARVVAAARKHAVEAVRVEAVEVLGHEDERDTAAVLRSIVDRDASARVQEAAVEALAESPANAPVLRTLATAHSSPRIRKAAVEHLGEGGASDLAALESVALRDGDSGVQRAAVEAVADMEGEEAVALLIRIAESHRNESVRKQAIEGLAEKASARVVSALERIASRDGDRAAQLAAFESLAELPNGDGIPFLVKTARTHPDLRVRKRAIEALGDSKDARARRVVLELAR